MYGIYLGMLLLGLLILPAVAVWPRLAFDARLAFAIPTFSVLVVTTLARLLQLLGAFNRTMVVTIVLGMGLVAVIRLWRGRSRYKAHWPQPSLLVYVFSIALMVPTAIDQGLTSFLRSDEIYSWNMWAVNHVMGEPPDLFYTQAPYPQNLPLFIATAYNLLGSIELQMPIKCSFALLWASMFAAIGMSIPSSSNKANVPGLMLFGSLAVFLLSRDLMGRGLSSGFSETLMVPSLVVSVALFLRHAHVSCKHETLWLSSALAVGAALAKQPALLWAMVSLPLAAGWQAYRQGLTRGSLRALVAPGLSILCGALWLVTEGANFQENRAVIRVSLGDRSVADQLLQAAGSHLLDNPLLGAMVATLVVSVAFRRSKGVLPVATCFLLPSMLLWFLFGSYGLRNGYHLIGVASLLIVASQAWERLPRRAHVWSVGMPLLLMASIYTWSMVQFRLDRKVEGFDVYQGGLNTIQHFFGGDAERVYREIYDREKTLWIPSQYIFGIFYAHGKVVRPDNSLPIAEIKRGIVTTKPEYLFDPGSLRFGRSVVALRELVRDCPAWFEVIASPPNPMNFTVYKLAREDIVHPDDDCWQ